MTASRKAQDFALVEAAGWAPVGVGIPQSHKGMSSAVAAPLSRPLFLPNHAESSGVVFTDVEFRPSLIWF